jgi:hypothetical protein
MILSRVGSINLLWYLSFQHKVMAQTMGWRTDQHINMMMYTFIYLVNLVCRKMHVNVISFTQHNFSFSLICLSSSIITTRYLPFEIKMFGIPLSQVQMSWKTIFHWSNTFRIWTIETHCYLLLLRSLSNQSGILYLYFSSKCDRAILCLL